MLMLHDAVAVRRHAGYPAAGVDPETPDVVQVALERLTPDEEQVLLDVMLPSLAELEAAIPAATATLDTKQAAVWHRNPLEMAERMALYRGQRVAMCFYLGIAPGPGIPPEVIIGPDGEVTTALLAPEAIVV